jgi:hypothetical protein
MTEIDHDKISDAATMFKEALTKMGVSNVVVLYSYTHNQNTYAQAEYESFTAALGLCEYAKMKIIFADGALDKEENPFNNQP